MPFNVHAACHFQNGDGLKCFGHGPCSDARSDSCRHMPITMTHERGNIYRLMVRGTLLKEDLDRCQEALAAEISRTGPVRLLFVLAGFEGWERGAAWNDLTFFVKHGDNVERIAIVGDDRWRSEALMFAGADLRKGPWSFFHPRRAQKRAPG